MALGLTGTLAAVGLGTLTAFVFSRVAEQLVGGKQLWVWPGSSAAYGAATAMAALAVAAGCWMLVRRWAGATGAHLGALLVWGAILLLATRGLPGASFLLLWPLIAASLAALVTLTAPPRVALLATWAATIVGASIIVPTIYLVAVMGLSMVGPAPVMVGLCVSLFAWLLAPQLETLTAPRRWVTPIALSAGAIALLAFDLATTRPTAAQPEGSMLAYAVDADSAGPGNAWLVTLPQYARRGSWAREAIESSARLLRPRALAGADSSPAWLTRALTGGSPTLMRAVPRVEVPPPDIRIIADAPTPEGRRVELRVRPATGTHSIRLRAVDTEVTAAAVDGRAIDPTHYRRRPSPTQWTLGYVAPPPEGFTLTLTVPAGRPIALEVIARSLGLPPAIAATIPTRTEGAVPIHEGDQTVVRRRVRL